MCNVMQCIVARLYSSHHLGIPSGAVDIPEGGIAWHDARIATLTRDGINAPSLLTLRQLAAVPATTVTPHAFIDVISLDYDMWDLYVTYGLESPTNRFRARVLNGRWSLFAIYYRRCP
jgi:hypothetical protein